MTEEIEISSTGQQPVDLLLKWAREGRELTGKAYTNPQSGITGFFIMPVGDTTETLDIFVRAFENTSSVPSLIGKSTG